jgi:cobyrinic acid a,c-diamide synthase
MANSAPGLILAAPASGSGKTVITLALIRALARRGRRVATAKIGPDYIDPAYHAAAGGRACLNLDGWAMRPALLDGLIAQFSRDADIVIAEGVMGLFDGAGLAGEAGGTGGVLGAWGEGSTADAAAATGWPVLLVVDAGGQAASAAAVVAGFARHRVGVTVAGALFNRIGGPRHAAMIAAAMADRVPEVPVCGFLPRDPRLALPARHLGLVQAGEHEALDRFLEGAADIIEEHVDPDALIAHARPGAAAHAQDPTVAPLPPLGRRIAVARDDAFAFCYPATLAGWRAAGAELSFFSPLANEAPEARSDAVYLPGGYPELHAGRLAGNARFLAGLREAAARDAPVFGECGGYMVLGDGLIDADGARHAMAGLLPLETSFADRRLHLGYRVLRSVADGPLGPRATRFRGHEFHYATILREGEGEPLFEAQDAAGRDIGAAGRRRGSVAGSFIHLIDSA